MIDMAVKFIDRPAGRIRGLAIPFGGPVNGKDLDNQAFSAKTDFAFDWFPHGRPLLYRHGLDGAVKMTAVGRQLTHEVDPEVGVWAEAQLDMSNRYADAISGLIEKRALGFTSGSVKHLTQADAAGNIVRWPWIEESLSPMPANPWATVDPVKTLQTLELLGFEVPAGLAEKEAIPAHTTATAPESEAWSKPTLGDFTSETDFAALSAGERRRIAEHAAWSDNMPPETFGDIKLFHHQPGKSGIGPVVWNGVRAAMAVLMGARRGVGVPDSARSGIYDHLVAHYKQFAKEPPELKEMSYTDEADTAAQSLADVAVFVARSRSLADLRAKEGRVMSTANRDRLSAFLDQLSGVAKSIDELLAETDPVQKGLLESEFLRFHKILAELPRAS
jgi:hypothetical protein